VTRARRRIVRLALMLKIAGADLSPVGNYRELRTDMQLQWSGLAPSKRKSARRQAQRLIAEAGSLGNAADHLFQSALQQASARKELPIGSSLNEGSQRPPERLRCAVCSSCFGKQKRSFPNAAAARRFCEEQRDPGLVVYACPAGIGGYHLGHRPLEGPATVGNSAAAHESPMLSTPKHKEYSMTIRATLGHPVLIFLYSTALFFIGSSVGRHWIHASAFWLSITGGLLMVVHDLFTGILMFVISARWVRSAMRQRE
jgi:hypothetical protein